jgi:hypothetical protein
MRELVQTDPARTGNRRTGLVRCPYLIDKEIAAIIPTENQSRTIRVPPIRTRRQGNHARQLTTNADASSRTQMKRNQLGTSTPLRMPPRCPVNATTRTAINESAQYPAARLLLSARSWRVRHHASVQIRIAAEAPRPKCKRRFPRSLSPSSCSCHASTPVKTAASAVMCRTNQVVVSGPR